MPSHYLNQCWNIVNWTLGNKLQWNFIQTRSFSFMQVDLKMLSGKWWLFCLGLNVLTHWSLVMHALLNWVITGSGNGLLPAQHQAIIQTKSNSLSTESFGKNFSEISIKVTEFSSKKNLIYLQVIVYFNSVFMAFVYTVINMWKICTVIKKTEGHSADFFPIPDAKGVINFCNLTQWRPKLHIGIFIFPMW